LLCPWALLHPHFCSVELRSRHRLLRLLITAQTITTTTATAKCVQAASILIASLKRRTTSISSNHTDTRISTQITTIVIITATIVDTATTGINRTNSLRTTIRTQATTTRVLAPTIRTIRTRIHTILNQPTHTEIRIVKISPIRLQPLHTAIATITHTKRASFGIVWIPGRLSYSV
jgi:hypothetical protein